MKNSWEKQQDGVIFKKIGIWDTLLIISSSGVFVFQFCQPAEANVGVVSEE